MHKRRGQLERPLYVTNSWTKYFGKWLPSFFCPLCAWTQRHLCSNTGTSIYLLSYTEYIISLFYISVTSSFK